MFLLELKDGIKRKKPIRYNTNESNCILVVSHHRDRFGHVRIKVDNKPMRLHRHVYELHHKITLDDSTVIRHKCDNPNCVNIEHLEIGTHADNVADRVERNRSAKGVKNGRSKLREEDVRFIRSNTNITVTELSKMFSVDRKAIYSVINNTTWKNI